MQQTISQHGVCAGRELQVQRRRLRGKRLSRINDDELATTISLGFNILHNRRHGFGDVATDKQNHFGVGNIFNRKRQAAINTKCQLACRCRARHTEATVVINAGSP